MYTIYSSIQELCEQAGVKPGKMCNDIGISRSILTDLKTGRKKSINTDTAKKIADYFGVSVDRVLGTEQKEKADSPKGTGLSPAKEKLIDAINDLSDEQCEKLFGIIEEAKKLL